MTPCFYRILSSVIVNPGNACGFLVVLVALASPASAEMYKWVDAQGGVHYSDRPPAQADAEALVTDPLTEEQRNQGQAVRERLLEQAAQSEQRARQRGKLAADRAEKDRQVAHDNAVACFQARRRFDVLSETLPVYRDDAGQFRAKYTGDVYEGERYYLDDEARAVELARVHQQMGQTCRDPNDEQQQALAHDVQIQAEQCEAAQAELAVLQKPSSRAVDDALANQYAEVEYLCNQ